MKSLIYSLAILALYAPLATNAISENAQPGMGGKINGDIVLNEEMNWPPSPQVEFHYNDEGYAGFHLSDVPTPGIHPRILMSPEDIPVVRNRLETTAIGQTLLRDTKARLERTIHQSGSKYRRAYQALLEGDFERYSRIEKEENLKTGGHYQRAVIYETMLQSFISMLYNDEVKGRESATVIATYAAGMTPAFQEMRRTQDNVSRFSAVNGTESHLAYGMQTVGFAYDFAYNFMTPKQRDVVRTFIATITKGAYSFGMELPEHFRVWNWMNVGNNFALLALAIEGEPGYDDRIYPVALKVFKDYIVRNYSKMGSSTEAAGYTTFGWRWGAPMLIAAARRGDHLATIDRYRAIPNWHAAVTLPNGSGFNSHGDGGNFPPGIEEVQIMKFLYPENPVVDYNWQNVVLSKIKSKKPLDEAVQMIAPMVCATDGMKENDGSFVDYEYGKKLNLPDTFHDAERGTLIARSEWSADAILFNMEARTDSFYAGHEHADRGNFNLVAHGVDWSRDGFRSVVSHFHNVVLIDGKGQGMWPPPADWMEVREDDNAVFATCNIKYAYDWAWPKAIVNGDVTDPKFKLQRFSNFKPMIEFYQENFELERETHPNVVRHFTGFDHPNALMWDEDGWTVRYPHNPVKRAFRTAGLVRGKHPYILVVDDIQKSNEIHLYEWILMLSMDTVALDIREKYGVEGIFSHPIKLGYEQQYTDILLGASSTPRTGNRYYPKEGDPLLLVRVLHKGEPEIGSTPGYDSRPAIRVETFEKKDYLETPNGRSFGMDRRLVIGSRSIAPDFRILLYPHRHGDPLPETSFAEDGSSLTVDWSDQIEVFNFTKDLEGCTRLNLEIKSGNL